MATITLDGFDELSRMLDKLGDVPYDVLSAALDGMAGEAETAVKATGAAYGIRDPESDVHILDKVTHSKPKQTEDGGYTYIRFSGSRKRGKKNPKRTRNAEIAFINEYGKKGQPARPFVLQASEQYADKISAPGEKILGAWMEKTFES